MEEHVYNYIKQEHPDKLMKKIKKELHSILPIDHWLLLDMEVLKKGTFLKKKLFLSVYDTHIIAFKEKGQKLPLSIIFFEFSLKVEWLFQSKQKDGLKFNRLTGFKLHDSDCEQSAEFSSTNEKDLISLYQILNNRINIIGFHESYKALKKIGKGSFASVYLVSHKETGVQYAVKAFSKEAVFSQDHGKESLINELKIMRMLDHPNILHLYEVCETENSLYMVMDLLQGGSLIDKIREKSIFTEAEAIPLMKGMLKAVEHAHSKGIMHRDLKPENILFRTPNCKEEDVVLADFGLSTVIKEKKYLFFRCGTPGYVAPEVINLKDENATYSEVCDVFSLGVIFHIMLVGKPPFTGKTYNEVINENKACNIDFNQEKYSKLSKKAKKLLIRMLEKDPKSRDSASKTLTNKIFEEGSLNQDDDDDDADTPLFLGQNGGQRDNDSSMFNGLDKFHKVFFSRKKSKINSLNSVDSPNRSLTASNGPKRHTVDVLGFKQHLHHDEESFNTSTNYSHLLVTREPIMNGQTKTVECVGDSSQNNSDLGPSNLSKFRKESLQVKIFKNPTVETCSPFLRRDLEDYKKELETDNNDKQQVISPMLIIRENEEEEEKKNDGN